MKNEKKKGFTLIELMVVVIIIGVLSLLGLRVYNDQQERAKNAIEKANAMTIQALKEKELLANLDLITIEDDKSLISYVNSFNFKPREIAGVVIPMNPKQYENKKSSWGLEYLWDQNICELNLAFNWEKYDIQIYPVKYFFIRNTINNKTTWSLAIGTFVDEVHPNMLMKVSQKIAQDLECSEEVEFIPVKIESVDKSILEMIRESSDLYTLYKKP
jgi:prepilin-type N-terminal cleavage/methylation domain-containing protein